MANWYGTSRSNYFRVKDAEAFKSHMDELGARHWSRSDGTFAVGGDDDGHWPSSFIDDTGECQDFDFMEEVRKHLLPGEVAIFQQAGAEKLRYVTGQAIAVHSDGRRCFVDINSIYALVKQTFGIEPTTACY